MKRLFTSIMLLVSILMLSHGMQNATTRYFDVECEEQWQTNTILIEDDNTIIYSISLLNELGIYKKWASSGNVVIIDSTATSARFYSNGPLKGRIYYYFDDDPAKPCQCGLGSVSLDVYKHFDAAAKYGVEIIGPDCIADGDSVVFSINPILTGNLYSGVGMDLYNWNIFDATSAPYVQSIPYVSGDSSSVTFKVGTMTGNDSITVRVGMANEEYRIVKYLGKAAPKPIVNDTCLPYDQSSFDVNVFNENYPDLRYDWTWPTTWRIQYIDQEHKSRVLLSPTVAGEEGTFSVTSSYTDQSGECTYASQASFNLTRSWGQNPYITPVDTVVANNCDFIEFELKDAYLSASSYPSWEIPNTWEFDGDEHHSTFKARPVNSTNDIDSIIVWEDVCDHKDSAKVYVYIRPKQVLSITDHGCLADEESYIFTAQSFSAGPEPVSYIWVYGGDTIKEATGNSVSIYADKSKSSLSVTSIGRYGYNSETTTFNLIYEPKEPTGIVLHNECIAYNMVDTVKFSILNPEPNQKYAWTKPTGWTMYDTIGNLNLDTCVRMLSNGIVGTYIVSARSVNENSTICRESNNKELEVEINPIIPFLIRQSYGTTTYYVIFGNTFIKKTLWKIYDYGTLINEYITTSGSLQVDNTSPIFDDIQTSTRYTLVIDATQSDDCSFRHIYGAPLTPNLAPERTGIRTNPIDNRLHTKIFPNPTKGEITINISNSDSNIADVSIYDINGHLVSQTSNFNIENKYNVSVLPVGNYFICIKQGEKFHANLFIKE